MVHVRLPRDIVKLVDHAAVDMETDRARAIELMLRYALTAGGGRWGKP